MKGFSYPGKSPLKQKDDKTKKIIGEDTLEGIVDKKGNIQRDIVPGPFVNVPKKSVLVTTPEQEKDIEKVGGYSGGDYIAQMHPMDIRQDSISGGKTYYSIPTDEPKKKKKKKRRSRGKKKNIFGNISTTKHIKGR